MRIVHVKIRNYRGIQKLDWSPAATVNCLIGPGDSTKTTILDAIELALNPRSYLLADDSDFFNLDVTTPIKITVTVAGLPPEVKSDDRYGLYLRGWSQKDSKVEDEPGEALEDALSIRVAIDESLEPRWSIYNDRIGDDETDPPTVRYKDTRQFATTRLGPYAERHLGWGRHSVLTRISKSDESVSLQLAQASRAARDAFRQNSRDVFAESVSRAEELRKYFAVPIRERYVAELDVQGINITTGGISLHDGRLPLRRLGTGSARLIVSALQHEAGGSKIALIDEIEHGLEPHRIARLLKYLKLPPLGANKGSVSQLFLTTHSPVVIRELAAPDLFAVRSESGVTEVRSVAAGAKDIDAVQRYLRSSPSAFLARRVLVGEGRTEQGLLRGLDAWWAASGNGSFALRGAIAIDGSGNANAPAIADHLLTLGYNVLLLLDSDEPSLPDLVDSVKRKGGRVLEWADGCSTEERMFLDVPWNTVIKLVTLVVGNVGPDSVRDNINNACKEKGLPPIADLSLSKSLDDAVFRRLIGVVA